jgi:hypothetical protein
MCLEIITNYFSKHKINYKKNLSSLCTDGAPAVLGKSSGFTALIKKEIPEIIITHCFLYRHALASKTLPTEMWICNPFIIDLSTKIKLKLNINR